MSEAIIERCKNVLCARFGEKHRDAITEATTMDDIDEWDSMSFLDLVVDLEAEFSVRFTPNETAQMFQVGLMATLLAAKL